MINDYKRTDSNYFRSPKNIEADKTYYEMSQRKDLKRNSKGKIKVNGLKAEDIKHYRHDDNSVLVSQSTKPPTLIVSIELTNKIAQEMNLGEVKGKLSERLSCRKRTVDLCVTAPKTVSGFMKR